MQCAFFSLHVVFFGKGENEPRMHLSSHFLCLLCHSTIINHILYVRWYHQYMQVTQQSSCKKIRSVSACVICDKYFLPEIRTTTACIIPKKCISSPVLQCSLCSVCVCFFLSVRGDPDVLLLPFKYLRTCSRSCKTLRLYVAVPGHTHPCVRVSNIIYLCVTSGQTVCVQFMWRIWDYRSRVDLMLSAV